MQAQRSALVIRRSVAPLATESEPSADRWMNAAGASTGEQISAELVKHAQTLLNSLGYDAGIPDGNPGPQTTAAVRRFRSRAGLTQTGTITRDVIRRLEGHAS